MKDVSFELGKAEELHASKSFRRETKYKLGAEPGLESVHRFICASEDDVFEDLPGNQYQHVLFNFKKELRDELGLGELKLDNLFIGLYLPLSI